MFTENNLNKRFIPRITPYILPHIKQRTLKSIIDNKMKLDIF